MTTTTQPLVPSSTSTTNSTRLHLHFPPAHNRAPAMRNELDIAAILQARLWKVAMRTMKRREMRTTCACRSVPGLCHTPDRGAEGGDGAARMEETVPCSKTC